MENDLLFRIDDYIERLLGGDDAALKQNLADATAAGLPEIQVSANQGRLLYVLTKLSGAQRVLEIGTLGGYSTTWLARAVGERGSVTTLELEQKHADIARKSLDRAGVGRQVVIEVGPAKTTLHRLSDQNAPAFDLIFIDADKTGYAAYLDLSLKLSRPGTVIIADNLIRDGAVMDENATDPTVRAIREFNATVAAHPRLDSIILPIARHKIDGLSISIVK